ncbi:MAG: hypothetical protein C0504_18355 [Candidatus Solibacter sp.]|nr:hypothetical protein [Candidatus Solibacter sp.]
MKIFALLLRYWSYIYSGLFGLFTAGIAAVLLISGSPNFRLSQIPFAQGKTALYILLAIGLTGILAALLALLKGMRPLLLVWTLVVFILLVYGYFISPKHYFVLGASEARGAAWIAFGGLGAFFGALMHYRKNKRS